MSALSADRHVDMTREPRRARFFFSAFAIALGLSVIFGFLTPLREPPSGDFHGEWAALLFFVCSAGFLVPVLPHRFAFDPSLLLVPLVLAALLALHVALGRHEYWQYPLFWLGYLALAVLAILVGQGIRAAGLTADVIQRLAWALVIAGVLNCCIQVIQVLRLESTFAPLVVRMVEQACRPYGNVGQPNQASTLAWLGLASALYLTGIGRLSSRWAMPIITVLLIGSALSASRMAWLFLGVAVAAVVFLPAWPAKNSRERRLIALMLACGFAVASYGAGLALAGIGPACTSGLERLADRQEGGMLVRLELWRQAIDVWRNSPWIGVGAFNFLPTVYAIESLDVHRPLDTYAHNVVLQLLAEFGIVGAGVLGTAVLIWMRRLYVRRRELHAADTVVLLWLGIIGVHAMLEFPLSYTYFLLIFCLSLGMLLRPEWAQRVPRLPLRVPMLGLVLCLLACAAVLFNDYRKLDRLFWLEDQRGAFSAAPTPEVRALVAGAAADVQLFRVQADHLLGLSEPINKDDLPRKIADADRLLAQSPQPIVSVRRIALAILADDPETARWHLQRLFGFFPRHADMMAATLRTFVDRRPEEFGMLGPIIDEELARRPAPRW